MLTTSFILRDLERERERERESCESGEGYIIEIQGTVLKTICIIEEIYVNEIVIFCVNYFYAYYISGRNSARCNPAFDRTFDI